MENNFIDVKITEIEQLSPLVKRFTLKSADGSDLPEFTGGAHIYLQFGSGDRQFSNAYSLCSSPFDRSAWQVAVKKEVNGRGGSIFMHDELKVGDVIKSSTPNNLFALDGSSAFLLIGGGIGITPFMSQIHELAKDGRKYELMYLKHDDEDDVIEKELTTGQFKDSVKVHVTARGTRADLDAVFAALPEGTAIYACGNSKLSDALKSLCKKHNIDEKRLHIEYFEVEPSSNGAFTLVLEKSGITVEAKAGETVLMAIERIKGPKIQCLCRAGACGTCEVNVLEGEVAYNDQYYEDDERDNKRLLACCCSGKSGKLVLDL